MIVTKNYYRPMTYIIIGLMLLEGAYKGIVYNSLRGGDSSDICVDGGLKRVTEYDRNGNITKEAYVRHDVKGLNPIAKRVDSDYLLDIGGDGRVDVTKHKTQHVAGGAIIPIGKDTVYLVGLRPGVKDVAEEIGYGVLEWVPRGSEKGMVLQREFDELHGSEFPCD